MERTVIEAKVSDILDEVYELAANENVNEISGYIFNNIQKASNGDNDAALRIAIAGAVFDEKK